jgi:dienelactone hydrolase
MRRLLAIALVLTITAAACGDDTTTAEAPTTTTEAPPSVTGADLAASGPYPVGVTSRVLPTGNAVEVWYPATPAAEGATDTYAVRDFLPEIMAELVPEEVNDRFVVAAGRDAAPAEDGPFPLVLFSHGSTSFRFQSTSLTRHLASWGMVVASADHPARSLPNLLLESEGFQTATSDVIAMRELVTTDESLASIIDAERVAVSGHSAGGLTTLSVAETDGIAGYVSYASGAFSDVELPNMPSLFMAGAIDTSIESTRTREAFDAAPSPSWYVEFESSGHLVFSDLCVVGDGNATLIDLAEVAGLEAFLTDGLRRLATDGCNEPNRPVEEVWPGIHQATTGFYRWIFGIDPEPLGLDASAVDGVTTEEK